GLGVLPQDLHTQDFADAIAWVKAQPTTFDSPIVLAPSQTAADALRHIPVAEGQTVTVAHLDPTGQLRPEQVIGVLSSHRLANVPSDAKLGDLSSGTVPVLDLSSLGVLAGNPRTV